jgi:hypothetical protein
MRDLILKALRDSVKAYPELVQHLSDEAIEYLKQKPKEEPEGWHERLKPYDGDKPYVFGTDDWVVTEKDIRAAIKTWNKLMPEYEGLLEAEVEAGE